jgi:proline racemase
MAPSIAQVAIPAETPSVTKNIRSPLKATGSLDAFEKFNVTSVIGTEFRQGVQIAQLLSAPNSDDIIRDLALLGIYN